MTLSTTEAYKRSMISIRKNKVFTERLWSFVLADNCIIVMNISVISLDLVLNTIVLFTNEKLCCLITLHKPFILKDQIR